MRVPPTSLFKMASMLVGLKVLLPQLSPNTSNWCMLLGVRGSHRLGPQRSSSPVLSKQMSLQDLLGPAPQSRSLSKSYGHGCDRNGAGARQGTCLKERRTKLLECTAKGILDVKVGQAKANSDQDSSKRSRNNERVQWLRSAAPLHGS